MKNRPYLSAFASITLLSSFVVQAKYNENSNPEIGDKLMKEVRSKLNVHYQNGSKSKFKTWDEKLSFCRADEDWFSHVQASLINPLADIIQKQQTASLKKIFIKGATVEPLTVDQLKPIHDNDQIKVYKWQRNQLESLPLHTSGTDEFFRYLAQYKAIENVEINAFDYFIDDNWRSEDSKFSRIKVFAEFNLNGLSKEGLRQSDKLSLILETAKEKNDWKIKSISLVEGERVASSRSPAFKEETKSVGLDDVPVYLRREAIRRGGYSVAVTDMNNDSVPDLFFGAGGKSQVFMGNRKEENILFKAATGPELPQGTFVKSSVFADFDNDGDQDAVLVRFVVDHEHDDELVFFRNNGKGEFKYEPLLNKASVHKRWAMPAAVADFNNDSFLDLYVGYPGKKDFTTLSQPGLEFTNNKILPHGMFFNSKGKAFKNVTKQMIRPQLESAGYLFPHSALAFDYDHNQTTDLIVIDDRNNVSPMYRNNGTSFDQVAKKIGIGNSGYGMSVAVGDYNSDGLIDIAMTNVNMLAEVRFRNGCDRNWNVKPDDYEKGLRLFKNEGNGNFSEVTKQANLGWPGAATAGILFFDYNNDGHDDIYVANGLWSGNKKGNDLDGLWAMANIKNQVLTNSLKYQTNGTQSIVMNLLINFQGNALDGKPEKGNHPSLGGFQKNKLYRNNGNGTFTEVAYVEGIDSIADGYGVVALDTNNDGRQEVLLRNADPGTAANKFSTAQFFKNQLQNDNHALTITLKGTDSSKDAIGTEVVAQFNGKKVVRQMIANNGPQQSQRTIHFGLGSNEEADIILKWPNGVTETKKALKAGLYQFEEPSKKVNVGAN